MNVEIIAELAQGFEGRPEQARLLMKAAASAGADSAKYQLVYADELCVPGYKHYELFKSLEMKDEVWKDLAEYSRELGIRLDLDVFGIRSLQLAEQIGVEVLKVHGTDLTNVAFLRQISKSKVKKVLLGVGGAVWGEIEQALRIFSSKEVVVLLGFQGYPTPNESNQIARVRLLVDRLKRLKVNAVIGFADHSSPSSTFSHALAVMAIGAGAMVIEKHLTLGKIMKLEDYEAALDPDSFLEFCMTVRGCVDAFGEAGDVEDFNMSASEIGYRKMVRRQVVSSRNLPRGTCLSPADVVLKRAPGEGLATEIEAVCGRLLKTDISANTPIFLNDLQ